MVERDPRPGTRSRPHLRGLSPADLSGTRVLGPSPRRHGPSGTQDGPDDHRRRPAPQACGDPTRPRRGNPGSYLGHSGPPAARQVHPRTRPCPRPTTAPTRVDGLSSDPLVRDSLPRPVGPLPPVSGAGPGAPGVSSLSAGRSDKKGALARPWSRVPSLPVSPVGRPSTGSSHPPATRTGTGLRGVLGHGLWDPLPDRGERSLCKESLPGRWTRAAQVLPGPPKPSPVLDSGSRGRNGSPPRPVVLFVSGGCLGDTV